MSIFDEKHSGVLMPMFSLPSDYGIGTLGKTAYEFVDLLKKSGQKYWQILPVNPTWSDNSPYNPYSAFAGNDLFIDFDIVKDWGYLDKSDYDTLDYGNTENCVDYKSLKNSREKVYKIMVDKFSKNIPDDFDKFCEDKNFWLEDFCLFSAIYKKLKTEHVKDWPAELRNKEPKAIAQFKEENKSEIFKQKVLQYIFAKQWTDLKDYANKSSVYIIGDVSFYVCWNSSDVWSFKDYFAVDKGFNVVDVAGVPPDIYSEDGQIWGFPTYKWDVLKENNFDWWGERLKRAFELYDLVRLDHYTGFFSYYSIDNKAHDARIGVWKDGPGMQLFDAVADSIPLRNLVAENTGKDIPDAKNTLSKYNMFAMKIFLLKFSCTDDDNVSPARFGLDVVVENSLAYLNTHDSSTSLGWLKALNEKDLKWIYEYFDVDNIDDAFDALIDMHFASKANVTITSIADILKLDDDARINRPAIISNKNWSWRMTKTQFQNFDIKSLLSKTQQHNR